MLPDSIVRLDKEEMTTKKFFTPKKVIMGAEVVGTKENLDLLDKNRQKWQSPTYPNLQADVSIPAPPIIVSNTVNQDPKDNGDFQI